jgi:hypothetical protein
MKYMLIFAGEEGGWDDVTPEQMKESMQRWSAFERELADAGALIAGEGLQDSSTATTIRIQDDGERIVSDGPFAETKEQVGGFYLIECDNLDQALEWAHKVPLRDGGIEIRPVMDYSQFGDFDRSEATAGASS